MSLRQKAVFVNTRRVAESFDAWPAALDGDVARRALDAARIEFVSAAEWRWNEGLTIPRRRIPTSTIAWHYGGAGWIRLGGSEHRIASPCVQVTPAGVWYDVRHDPGHPLASIGMHFQAPLPSGGELVETLGFPVCLRIDAAGMDRPLVTAMETLARLDARRPIGWRLLARAELVRVLMHLVLQHGAAFRPAQAVGSLPSRLAPVFAVIERELAAGPIAIGDLASTAGMSAVHLRTLFRRTTGRSPHRYVQSRRIAIACRLLREDARPIAEVAEHVGVPDLRVFHRMFKAITGTTPARWRREM